MTVSVRPIRPVDLDKLLVLCAEHAAFERATFETADQGTGLARALFEEPVRLRGWIAEDDRPLGYLMATLDFSTWRARDYLHMDCLFVREGYRGAGVGLRLFEALCEHAKAVGIDEIQWQTPDWNHDAARFYRRLGARESRKLRYCHHLDSLHSFIDHSRRHLQQDGTLMSRTDMATPQSSLAQLDAGSRHVRLQVKVGRTTQLFDANFIEYVEADGDYVAIHRTDGTVLRTREGMAALGTRLPTVRFKRIHRSIIVNLDCVREVRSNKRGGFSLVVLSGRRLTAGATYRNAITPLITR